MHVAYHHYEVLSSLPLDITITSLAATSKNLVFVGTRSGLLLIYTIIPCQTAAKIPFNILLTKSLKNFSKRPIIQMAIVVELQLLISITDVVFVHSIRDFIKKDSSLQDTRQEQLHLLGQLTEPKGAAPPSIFAADFRESDSTLRLCVAYKKVAQLYEWRPQEKRFVPSMQLPNLPDIVRAMTLTNDNLFCGFAREYFIISLRDGYQRPLFSTGNNMGPIVSKLGTDAIALGYDNDLIPQTYEGKPLFRTPLKFTEAPLALEYDEPYIIAINHSSLEIRPFMSEDVLAQRVEIRSPLCITKHENVVWVASKNSVWRLTQVPTEKQIAVLTGHKFFKLAQVLAERFRDANDADGSKKRTRINSIKSFDALHKFNMFDFDGAFAIFHQLNPNPLHVLGLYPDLISLGHYEFQYHLSIAPITKKELDKAISALVRYLWIVRTDLISKEKKGSTSVPAGEYFSLVKDFDSSHTSLADLRQSVDTALLKCYVITNDTAASRLLKLEDNRSDYETSKKILLGKRKFKELVVFYQSRKEHLEALNLLRDLAGQSNSSLSGHEMTVEYLQKLGPSNLEIIFECSRWVLDSFPKDGLLIFTDSNPECEKLPIPKVMKFLKEISNKLAIQYLEHVVFNRDIKKQQYHNNLALFYKDEICELMMEYIASLSQGQIPARAGEEPGDLGELRTKLLKFLSVSLHYDARELLVGFPMDSLYEEQAILNGRMGNHDKALSIYIHVLKDEKRAESYCEDIVSKKLDCSNWENVYFSLFCTYIEPKATTAILASQYTLRPNVDAALNVLENHWDSINLERALKMLPDTIPLKLISTYLQNVLRKTTNQKRDDQIQRSLLGFEFMRIQRTLDDNLAENFELSEDVCEKCRNKIGNLAKFVRCPTESSGSTYRKMYHLSCFKSIPLDARKRSNAIIPMYKLEQN